MGKTIVGMVSSYRDLTQSDWLWKQTPHPFGHWGTIQMQAQHPQPDLLLLYQFDFFPFQQAQTLSWKQRLKRGQWRTFLPGTPDPAPDPEVAFRGVAKDRRVYLMREPPLEEILHKNQTNYRWASQYCGYVSGPDEFAPQPDYMPAIWYVNQPFQVLNEAPPPTKLRPCSWITSGINRTENHRRRLAFLRQVQDSALPVDIYGRGLPDWVHSHGSLGDKWFGMAPYTYNLAIENYADNDLYVSEKLWDALLSWCLPIYYGGPAADRLLPPGSFLRLPSLDERGLALIQETIASPDAWYAAKDAIAEARQIILHRLNLLNWLSDYGEALR